MADPPTRRHAILVFGAAVDHDGTVRRPLARRLSRALAEAAADPAALVIVSGGSVDGRPAEAPIMRDWLVAQGLDPARILVEAEARSTAENARYCVDLVVAGGFRRITLVTERFHMLRARFFLGHALTSRGLRVELRISEAPDHLGAFQRIATSVREVIKLAVDLGRRRR